MFIRKEETFTDQTLGEEIANTITHGIGFVFSIVGLVFLISKALLAGGTIHLVCSVIYGSSLIAAYMSSTLYHLSRNRMKRIMQRLDHISIYLLITGTYMPISLLVLEGYVGWTLFGVQCSFCALGITMKAIFGIRYPAISGAFYLLMGWLVVFAIKPLVASLPIHALAWLVSGGIFYTFGFIFFALDQRYHYFHMIWHLFVLAGSFAHFYLISTYVFAVY